MTVNRCRRCPTCLTNWPILYAECPECGDKTRWGSDEPIDAREAKSRANHAKFADYYRRTRGEDP